MLENLSQKDFGWRSLATEPRRTKSSQKRVFRTLLLQKQTKSETHPQEDLSNLFKYLGRKKPHSKPLKNLEEPDEKHRQSAPSPSKQIADLLTAPPL